MLRGDLSAVVVLLTTMAATYTDVRTRIIHRRLTVPVLLTGLCYSLLPYLQYLKQVTPDGPGLYLVANILWVWLEPVILVTLYALFIFWLGILDGGDGHFLIAITPWCEGWRMVRIIVFFYPAALLYLFFYLLCLHRFSVRALVNKQVKNTRLLFKHWRVVCQNIAGGEPDILSRHIPYEKTGQTNPPAMIPLGASVVFTYLTGGI